MVKDVDEGTAFNCLVSLYGCYYYINASAVSEYYILPIYVNNFPEL